MEGTNFANVILRWYESNARQLPWRTTTDPYRIWLSEVILQQTRVDQGLAYYLRFVERFPDVESLAGADEDEVMRLWQGLGYYSRARNLHQAAKSIAGKPFPDTYDKLRSLKGVGDYTAAAIASIAFQLPYAVVDGNVYRVLARYFGIAEPIDTTAGKRLFADLARQLLDTGHPGVYNQALMDFGALQCVPAAPRCDECPLLQSCAARSRSLVGTLPVKSSKPKTRRRCLSVVIVRAGATCFIRKRKNADIWRGLWEFPTFESDEPLDDVKTLVAFPPFATLFGDLSLKISPVAKGIRHILTHRTILADIYLASLDETATLPGFRKVDVSDLDRYAFPRMILPYLPK